MNKCRLAMNAWRAYSAARRTEGSSLRGTITAVASVVAVVGITLWHGDLTAADAGIIAASISGLDAVLAYFIPDQLGSRLEAKYVEGEPLPPIELVGQSAAGRNDMQSGTGTGNADSVVDRLQSVSAEMPPDDQDKPGNGWNS